MKAPKITTIGLMALGPMVSYFSFIYVQTNQIATVTMPTNRGRDGSTCRTRLVEAEGAAGMRDLDWLVTVLSFELLGWLSELRRCRWRLVIVYWFVS
jgi:hypothetical protein